MNKTISINIGGQFFHIDEEAFNRLDNYINAIKSSINTEGKEEIIADIESRIAELFQQRIQQPNGVIRQENVEEIITIMGQPEDYIIGDEEPIHTERSSFSNNSSEKASRKLYRDPDQRMIGGVCTGIGHYFNIDPVWVRILFVVLIFFYGVTFLIYPILWLIIPKAVTPSQILEMKGIPVNINNIEKEVRDSLGKYIDGSKKVVSTGTNLIKKFIGITLIIFGTSGLLGSGFAPLVLFDQSYGFEQDFPLSALNIQEYLNLPMSEFTIGIFFFLCCAIPFIIMILIGIKLMYSKLRYTRWIALLLSIIWLISVFMIGLVITRIVVKKDKIKEAIENLSKSEITNKTDLMLSSQDTLVLNFINDSRLYANDTLSNNSYNTNRNIKIDFATVTTGEPYMEIEETKFVNSSTNISINNGVKNVQIEKIPTSLPYEVSFTKPVVNLSKHILYTYKNTEDKYAYDYEYDSSKVRIKFYLREGQLVKLNDNDERYFYESLGNGIQVYKFTNGELESTQIQN